MGNNRESQGRSVALRAQHTLALHIRIGNIIMQQSGMTPPFDRSEAAYSAFMLSFLISEP